MRVVIIRLTGRVIVIQSQEEYLGPLGGELVCGKYRLLFSSIASVQFTRFIG